MNRRIGVEINDGDRIFYGFSLPGVNFRGFNSWFYQGGYDFNRFDRRGFGNIRMGYNNRNYCPTRQIDRGHHDNNRRVYSDNRFGKNRKYDNRRRYAENRDERNSNREMPRVGADTRGNERRNMPRIQNNEPNPVRTETPRSIDNGGRSREQPQAPTENRNGRAGSEDRGMRAESIVRPDIEAPRERANGRRGEL